MGQGAAVAERVVDYCLDVKAGDRVAITTKGPRHDLADAVYAAVQERGALPSHEFTGEEDAYANIFAPDEPYSVGGVGDVMEVLADMRWCLVGAPTDYMADRAGMSHADYADLLYENALRDWETHAAQYDPLGQALTEGDTVRITAPATDGGPETDITFDIGRRDGVERVGVVDDGRHNLPAGEIFTCPLPDSVNGTIHTDTTYMYEGTPISGITLQYEDGALTDARAREGEWALYAVLNADKEAQRIGEIGIGTNFSIDRLTKSTLLDEKIGGTVHIALGDSIPYAYRLIPETDDLPTHGLPDTEAEDLLQEAADARYEGRLDASLAAADGAVEAVLEEYRSWAAEAEKNREEQQNSSSIHIDLVKDLRDGGTVTVDGEPVLKDGTIRV